MHSVIQPAIIRRSPLLSVSTAHTHTGLGIDRKFLGTLIEHLMRFVLFHISPIEFPCPTGWLLATRSLSRNTERTTPEHQHGLLSPSIMWSYCQGEVINRSQGAAASDPSMQTCQCIQIQSVGLLVLLFGLVFLGVGVFCMAIGNVLRQCCVLIDRCFYYSGILMN